MIYEIKRDNIVIFQHEIKGNRTQSAPAVDFVDIEFDYYEAILLKRNDTIEFDGQIYYCDRQYANYQKKSNNLYNHKARFVSENYRATEIAVLDPQDVSKFEIEGNLLTLLTLAVDNLNRVSSGWSYATPVPNTVTKLFIIEEENVMSFLTKVSGEFEIPFYIKNKVVTFAYPNITDEGDFSYGKGNGFLDINKSYKSGEKVANTIYVTGGDDLVLDNPVVHTGDVNVNGVIEGFYNNDNIKPTTRTQVVGSTSTENVATTNLINYDLNLYKIAGQSPIINFETGALAGLSFFVTKFDYNVVNNVSLIYFKKRFVDGTEYPNSSAKPNNGDFFNITNITQPQAVIDEAKITLKTRAESYLNDLILKNLVLKVNLDRLFNEDLELNNRIRIVDNNLDIDDYFIVNEIKTDLQNLNKKELQLGHIGTAAFAFTLPTLPIKNDNVIELGIDRNYDDLVKVEEDMGLVKADTERVKVDLEAVEFHVSDLESSFENIETVELPSKENLSNKKTTLDFEEIDDAWYPNITAVKAGLDDTLIQANNYTNNAVNNAVGGSGVVNSVTGVNVDNSDPKNPIVAEFRPIAQYNSDISNIQSQLNTKLESGDLDGFIYDVQYNSTDHRITFYLQNEPNIVIDLPIEQLIKGVQLVDNDLIFTFEDGSTVTVPLNTLLVGVVKSVNGLTPNSQGEIILNVTDIPNLSSELANKLDIRMAGLVSDLTQPEKDAILTKLGVVNNIVQVLGLSGNTITLSNGGGSISLNIANIGGLQNELNKIGNLPSLTTTNKNNLVDAINEVNGTLGNYVNLTTNQIIGGQKTFTASTSRWLLANNSANAYGFVQSAGSGFYTGTLSDHNYEIYRNTVRKITVGENSVTFVDNISSLGFVKQGQNDTQILLAGGGHRPVSDFALSWSLGNYVNKAGDTMSGTLNLPSSKYYISGNGNERHYYFQPNVNKYGDFGIYSNNASQTDALRYDLVIADNGWLGVNGVSQAQAPLHVNGNAIVADAIAPNHAVAFGQLANYALLSQVYTQSQALGLFVGLNGVQTIADTKTFTSSPIVPNATLNGHAVNLGQMQAYVASQIPGNSGIERIQTDNSTNPGPAEQPTLYFNFHEYWGFPQAFAEETQPGNATAKATQGQLDFFASYDSVQTMIEDSGTADVDMKGYHIVNVLLQSAGGDVYLPDGVYTGDQINITTHPNHQINIYANNLIATTGNEVRTFANLVWDCELEGWVMTAFGAL